MVVLLTLSFTLASICADRKKRPTTILLTVANTQAIPTRIAAPPSLGKNEVICPNKPFKGVATASNLKNWKNPTKAKRMMIQKTTVPAHFSIGKVLVLEPVNQPASLLSKFVRFRRLSVIEDKNIATTQPPTKIAIAITS